MGVLKTAENGKAMEKRQVPLQRVPEPQHRGKLFSGRVYWLVGLAVGGAMMAVAIITALVYIHRIETLQSRVDLLEQHVLDVETTMKNYVDDRLRIMLYQQVSNAFVSFI